jgi:ABC-type transporter Mla subunit MlaD
MVAPTPSLSLGTFNVNLGDLPQDVRDIRDAVVAQDPDAQPLAQNAQEIHDAVVAEDPDAHPLVQNAQEIHDAVVAEDPDAHPLVQNAQEIRDAVVAEDPDAHPLVQNAQEIHDAVVAEDPDAHPLVQNVQEIYDAVVAEDPKAACAECAGHTRSSAETVVARPTVAACYWQCTYRLLWGGHFQSWYRSATTCGCDCFTNEGVGRLDPRAVSVV